MIDKKIKRYNLEVKNKYSKGDSKLNDFISNPTASNLKLASIELLKEENSKDYEIMKRFFGFQTGSDEVKTIEHFSVGKFKSLTKFLNGESEYIKSHVSLDLIAALVEFPNRPYSKYLRNYEDNSSSINKKKGIVYNLTEKYDDGSKKSIINENNDKTIIDDMNDKRQKSLTKKVVKFIGIIAISATVYFSYNTSFMGKYFGDCMIWKEDHYERTICSGADLEEPFIRQKLENFKKIEVCDTTTFFINDKAIVWYNKSNNIVSYFTETGENPMNGKDLNPITLTIIKSHVKPCDSL